MKKKNKNIAGKIITVLQLIVSVICIVVAKNSGLFPRKYLTLFIVGLGFLFVLTHVFQYPKSKSWDADESCDNYCTGWD